jgi:hypothetical protein
MMGLKKLTLGLVFVAGAALAQETTLDRETTRGVITPILMSLPLQGVGTMSEAAAYAVAGCVVNGASAEEILALYDGSQDGSMEAFPLMAEILQREEVVACVAAALG